MFFSKTKRDFLHKILLQIACQNKPYLIEYERHSADRHAGLRHLVPKKQHSSMPRRRRRIRSPAAHKTTPRQHQR